MNFNNLCINCMKEKPDGADICPHCGFDVRTHVVNASVLPPFTVLRGRYILGKVLGSGGFGITYLALDTTLERTVAIKEFFVHQSMYRNCTQSTAVSMNQASEEQWVVYKANYEKFVKEAKMLARLEQTPGIVRVYDFFEENDTAYMVMEYLSGRTLKSCIQQSGPLKLEQLLPALERVMQSLGQLHANGIIHRDISPDNIMVAENGTMTLFDFGGVKITADTQKSSVILAKPGYSPLEQMYSTGETGPWVDVYAMAATIYYCITGMVPPESMGRVYDKDTLRKPSELGVIISPAKENALLKGLAIRYQNRYGTMKELWNGLMNGEGSSSPVQPMQRGTTGATPVQPMQRGTTGTTPVQPTQRGTAGTTPVQRTGAENNPVPPVKPVRTGTNEGESEPKKKKTNWAVRFLLPLAVFVIVYLISSGQVGNLNLFGDKWNKDETKIQETRSIISGMDINTASIAIGEDIYIVPMPWKDLVNKGWEKEDGLNPDKELKPNEEVYAKLLHGEFAINVVVKNFDINMTSLQDCYVTTILIDKKNFDTEKIPCILPQGIEMEVSTKDEVLAKYGEPTDREQKDGREFVKYPKDKSYDVFTQFEVGDDSGVVEAVGIRNRKKPADFTDSTAEYYFTEEAEILYDGYEAPLTVSDDMLDPIVVFDGCLLRLPISMQTFTGLGFEMPKDPVPAYSKLLVELEEDGDSYEVDNTEPVARLADCCVIRHITAATEKSCLSGYVMPGADKNRVIGDAQARGYEVWEDTEKSECTITDPTKMKTGSVWFRYEGDVITMAVYDAGY